MLALVPAPSADDPRGIIYYDAGCSLCRRVVAGWGVCFARRGYRWEPLQAPGTAERLGVAGAALIEEMRLALPEGRVVAGADAWAVLLRSVWWLWPLGFALSLPGLRQLGRKVYRWVARHRNCPEPDCEHSESGTRRCRTIPFLDLP